MEAWPNVCMFLHVYKIFSIGADINSVFGSLLMFLLMSTAFTLCCAAIYTLTQGLGKEFIEYCAFLPCCIGQYYLVCHYGQQMATLVSNGVDSKTLIFAFD